MPPETAPILPTINACLNGFATVLLTVGFYFNRRQKHLAHGICMTAAIFVSAVFLIGYVADKIIRGGVHTAFAGEGFWKAIYYTMLITHIVAAMVILPLVLWTWSRALKKDFSRHRRWAKFTFPLWYYVSVTGVLVYLFLYQLF